MNYRQGIAAIILSADRSEILLGERTRPRGQWQLPQGGAEKGETLLETLEREVLEEVGVSALPVLGRTAQSISYEWPKGWVESGAVVGQTHVYFLLDGSGVDLRELVATPEFASFGWFSALEVLERAIVWKNAAVRAAFLELGLLG